MPLGQAVPDEVEALLDAAFGADRHARTAYRLRAGAETLAALSFAALGADGDLVGTLQCWPVTLVGADGTRWPLVLVGPVAVAPARQGTGIGAGMMGRMLAAADAEGAPGLILVGDAPYYGRFGFDAARTGGWALPGPVERHRLLARLNPRVPYPVVARLAPAALP